MPVPFNLRKHYEIISESNIPVSELFEIPKISAKEKFIRTFAPPVVNLMPTNIRYLFTNTVKKIRNPSGKLRLNYPLDFPECRILGEKLKNLDLSPWWNKKAAVCVCHDVDNKEGADFAFELAEIDRKHSVPATFNFLTHNNYRIESALMNFLITNGFEIGLHGYTHDQGFAFRNPESIKSKIDASLEVLGKNNVFGYRAPALCTSKKLFEILHEKQFLYDSSLQISSPFYHSVRIPYPYYMENYGLWELPVTIQDDNYLRDTDTKENIILESVKRFLREIITLNGVFVINMHPHLMVKRKIFYENLLHTIKESDNIIFATMAKVIKYAGDATAPAA